MEKPDQRGFVNITWPSKSVPHGGIFHTRTVEPTSTQQQFLRVLLEESKLTISQRRKSALALREYESKEVVHRIQTPSIRPRTSRRRSLSAIRESGALDMDGYRPLKRGEDRELLKEKLANAMAYGDEEQKPPPAPRLLRQPPKLPSNKEKWNELVTQIRERAEWLAEMEELGEADPHREIVKDQIAERLRALDALGIDSACSSTRSNKTAKSGFSVLDCARQSVRSNESGGSANKSVSGKQKPRGSAQKHIKEENIMGYNKLSPLQYSPRRRV